MPPAGAGAQGRPGCHDRGRSQLPGQRVTRALENREHSGELTAAYVKKTIRTKGRTGRSAGWDAMVRGGRLDASFEDMTLNHPDPLVRGWFNDEDRAIAARALEGVG